MKLVKLTEGHKKDDRVKHPKLPKELKYVRAITYGFYLGEDHYDDDIPYAGFVGKTSEGKKVSAVVAVYPVVDDSTSRTVKGHWLVDFYYNGKQGFYKDISREQAIGIAVRICRRLKQGDDPDVIRKEEFSVRKKPIK